MIYFTFSVPYHPSLFPRDVLSAPAVTLLMRAARSQQGVVICACAGARVDADHKRRLALVL